MFGKYVRYEVDTGLPSEGTVFVDHSKKKRSGHLSHALVEYKKDCILSFYSNCSGTRPVKLPGHSGFGWLETRRSLDGGHTWSEPTVLEHSWHCFLDEPYTVSCEFAVSTKDDEIVAFLTRMENPNGWEPHGIPCFIRSFDGGHTWSEPTDLCERKGRIFDAIVIDGEIYVLMHANDMFFAKTPENIYYIYKSDDGGKTFAEYSSLPNHVIGYSYGNLVYRDDGALICYRYLPDDEFNMPYDISYDKGKTWTEHGMSRCAKRIRNPQVVKVKGGYLLHGRSGLMSFDIPIAFVLYTSKDGINWDEGEYLCEKTGNGAYYSNNHVFDQEDGSQRVLIQASIPWGGPWQVNVNHWWLTIK